GGGSGRPRPQCVHGLVYRRTLVHGPPAHGITRPDPRNTPRPRRPRRRLAKPSRCPPAGEVRKPSSVSGDHSSRPGVTDGLERPTRGHRAGHATPVWSCFGWGLPCPLRHRRGGALLPHPFTPTHLAIGRLLSVARSSAA